MQAERTTEPARSVRFWPLGVVAAILVLGLLLASSASADYEQVGNFAQGGEGEQLQNATGMAVNVNGTGGVSAGSVYVVGLNARVLRYTATGEFEEAWGWGVADGAEAFQRCGPALKSTCTPPDPNAPNGGEEVGHFTNPAGVAVDQATGYVYVLNANSPEHREKNLVEVFSADGSKLIARFGDTGARNPNESIAEGPEKLHTISASVSDLAVDGAGKVYVTDYDYENLASPPREARVMCFAPQSPGDYEHYVYCGRSTDIRLGEFSFAHEGRFTRIALDDAGHLYGANSASIEALSPAEPTSPICTYKVEGGGLQAMTVNPVTGEVFYFTYKDKKVHRLGPCDVEMGVFEEAQSPIAVTPKTEEVEALAVNPGLVWGALRPAGVLYGADGENHFEAVPPRHGSGDIFAPAEVHSPSVESESVVNTGTVSSTLRAEVDPHGFTTRFAFQYLNEAAYEANEPADRFAGASEAPLGGGVLEGGHNGLATAAVSGLAPGTEYRFRVVATSECEPGGEPCQTAGPVAVFRTFPVARPGPPDGRGYELVSPIDKHGGEVFPADPGLGSCGAECKPPGGNVPGTRFPMQSAPGGDGVVYEGQAFSPTEGAAVYNEYLSRRTGSGWQTTALSPALEGTREQGPLAFDQGLGDALVYQESPSLSPEAPSGYSNLYAQSTAAPGSLTPLLTAAPPNQIATAFKLEYAGHSADFSRQFFAANDALTSETPFAPAAPAPNLGESDLYEWSGGQLRLVNVMPGNTTVASGAVYGSIHGSRSPDTHVISADGSRVFWSDGAGHLYVRENGETTEEVLGGSPSAQFLTASADGSRVLLSDGQLVGLGHEKPVVDLARGEGGFQGVAGQSEDLSRVYFVDTAVLTGTEANGEGAKALAGKDNLYSWDEGVFRFVSTLAERDNGSEVAGGDWAAAPSRRTAEASPGGRWLAFLSQAPLTGYDNTGPACGRNSLEEFVSAPCSEVFVYDSATGELRCASCDPSGEPPLGRSAALRRIAAAEEWLPQPRYLTDTGRLLFDSSDRLSPRDTNNGVEDVYEFEPNGVGTCERVGGCVLLISTGAGTHDANFLAMDETGANVFFTTRERLVPGDRDELVDLYDAREGGGFATESEPGSSVCQGEACQPSLPGGVHGEPYVSSSFFMGAGNLAPPALLQSPPVKPKARVLTRAQKLASALRACRKKSKRARSACKKAALRKYATSAKRAAANNGKGGR